jgi:signal transduction histidine kinase
MFVFDSNLGNIKILFIGDKVTSEIIDTVLNELVESISFTDSYSSAMKYLSEHSVDIVINSLEHLDDNELHKTFQKVLSINTKLPVLLIIDETEIKQIRKAIKYNIDNFILYPIDKDIVVEELNRMVNNIYHKIEVTNINKQLQELNQTLDKKVQEEIEKNKEKDHMMYHQSRLAAMGEMIGNIAHQWRQPLTAISTIIQTIEYKEKRKKLDSEFLYKQTELAKQIVSQMSQTIDDFRNFFKPNKLKESFLINDVLKHNIKFLSVQFKSKDIEVVFNENDNIELLSYKNELSQAILNILNNAKDALLTNNDNTRKLIFMCTDIDNTNNKIDIILQDNAGGIPNDIINKIFDPYFTTKHQSHGTGIGLYMTKQIIETNMKGKIRVENNLFEYEGLECKGARFIISLPFVID